jgi:hypothetical protein
MTFVPMIAAQTLTIRLVNAKTGKPMKNKNVKVEFWWDDPSSPNNDKRTPINFLGTDVYIDKNSGVGHIEIPQQATFVEVSEGSKIGKEPYRVAYETCNAVGKQIPLADVLRLGYVPENTCSKSIKVKATAGEYVFFGLPIPWWWIDME